MNLSEAQARALAKLTREWQSAFYLDEKLLTLGNLVTKGYAEERIADWAIQLNVHTLSYRLKNGGENESKAS